MKKRIDHYASYKDPAAKVFFSEDETGFVFRELAISYLPHYNHFISSGLSTVLLQKNYIVSFETISNNDTIILKAKKIEFVSFPYEWSFNQWKDAALLTLKIHYQALKCGMVLKDATPFNIVFDGSKPLLVDLSSFEVYEEGKPWQAFKQFCENFYMPLLLAKYFDATANDIYLSNTAGIQISKGLHLLPAKVLLNINTLLYLALPNRVRNSKNAYLDKKETKKISLKSNIQLAEGLFETIHKINQKKLSTRWNQYYVRDVDTKYYEEKETVIKEWLSISYHDKVIIDFGCNTGQFSILLSPLVKRIIAFDEDIRSVDALYLHCRQNRVDNIYCFRGNISEPAPSLGWSNLERPSLNERLKADVGLALALIHHLAITHYISFEKMAAFFSDKCNEVVIEFVPKEDEKIKLLLNNRTDIFQWYTLDNFIAAFSEFFNENIRHQFSNQRILFHFTKK